MADKLTLDRHDMKDRATSHLRIYVGGVSDQVTADEIYDHFIQFGQINGIVLNRNFGFVQFETEQSALDAISKADGSVLQGKTISVRTAQTNTDKQSVETCVEAEDVVIELSDDDDGVGVVTLSAEANHQQPVAAERKRVRTRPQVRRRRPKISRFQTFGQTEVVTITSSVPPAVALTDNIPAEDSDDLYDNFGNYIGDSKDYGEEDDGFPAQAPAGRGGPRGRGPRGGPRGRGARGRGGPAAFQDRSPVGSRGGEWADRGGYDRYNQKLPDYPRALPVTERNDCEIIVVSKALTEYAEYIEGRLKRLGIVVDLLFPMEDVPIGKVLGNIASRGCLYAILVMPLNQEHRSLTLTILHGLPQEHRNMPLEDALQLMSRNFQEVQRGGPSGREAVYALLGQLADGRTLTVLQYDKVIEYLQERREQQVKIELGEPLPTAGKKEVDLQQRILSILNEKKAPPAPPPAAPAPAAPQQTKLLNDPTVRKALDSILQKLV